MRTLAEMRDRCKRWLDDIISDSYDASTIDFGLEEAMNTICNLLVNDKFGHNCLKMVSSTVTLSSGVDEYQVPANCLRVAQVEIQSGSDWTPLKHIVEIRARTDGTPQYWVANTEKARHVRLYPTPTSGNIRYRYYGKPTFPTAEGGTFNNADGTGDDDFYFPDDFDTLAEFLCVAYVSHEEIQNNLPTGAFGSLFSTKYNELVGGAGAGVVWKRPTGRGIGEQQGGPQQ